MIPLVVRSYYSLMWGTRSPQAICAAARRLGYTRLALTDTDNLYGLWPFLQGCRDHGLVPIVGAEISDPLTAERAVCLVENDTGYRSLCRLISRRRFHAVDPETAFCLKSDLPAHADGLTVLTPSVPLLTAWHAAGVRVAAAMPRKPHHNMLGLRRTARRLGVALMATPGSFFLEPSDAAVHRLLRAIDRNTSLSKLHPHHIAPADAWLAPAGVYRQRFAPWPEAVEATQALAERLDFRGPPQQVILPPWQAEPGESVDACLRRTAYSGARRRYGSNLPEAVVRRLEHELNIIADMAFAAYFLVVRDIVSRSPRICGRGSGAASLVAYCLGVTNVCPIKHNLYFERFLNPGRKDPPDIDVDFAWDERDAVLSSVLGQYRGHAAMVCNHVAFRPRMAIREVAKVYGLTAREIGQVVKRLPWFWKPPSAEDDLLTHLRRLPALRQQDFAEPWPEVIGLAQRIIGVPRYISVHVGGVVITPVPIEDLVPVEPAPKGVPVIQWEKDAAEEAGLVKIDLLGNRSLGVIRDAIANVRRNGHAFDERRWEPEDDPATRFEVARGRTMGCFYIESPATRLLQQKTRVGDFEHMVIHSSIIRPAANAFIREYIRRLHGGAWEAIHPLLVDVLDETYGIMVYQEDVSKTAVAVAGFSHAEADELRKILSKKDKQRRLIDLKERFAAGARRRGVPDRQIDTIWEMMMSFAGYSFCKPHSASFARVSFQSAFLKTHFPAEFMAAVISNQGGFYSTFAYVSEARRMGMTILPPDVGRSNVRWRGRANTMRVGLLSVHQLGAATRDRIVANRKSRPYADLNDFLNRIRPSEPEARTLIHAGALDPLSPGDGRAEQLWQLAAWLRSRSRKVQTARLFQSGARMPVPKLPPQSLRERLRCEYGALGFLCDRHPMALYKEVLRHRGIVKAVDMHLFIGQRIRVAGLLLTGKLTHTRHGDPMEFLTFEDDTGLVETTFFPEAYRRFCFMLNHQHPYILSGTVDEDFGAVTLTVDKVEHLK